MSPVAQSLLSEHDDSVAGVEVEQPGAPIATADPIAKSSVAAMRPRVICAASTVIRFMIRLP
jgi:hypothetical protein